MKKHYITPETFILEGRTEKHLLAGSYDVDLGIDGNPNNAMDGDDARAKQSFDLELDE